MVGGTPLLLAFPLCTRSESPPMGWYSQAWRQMSGHPEEQNLPKVPKNLRATVLGLCGLVDKVMEGLCGRGAKR